MAPEISISEFRAEVLELMGGPMGYAYNGMELCRAINGFEPFDHKGCHFTTDEKGWGQPKGGCQYKARGCGICQRTALSRLDRMQTLGQLGSVKIRFFDSRNPGCAPNSLPLDMFRFFYRDREGLARRLHHDITGTLGWVSQ